MTRYEMMVPVFIEENRPLQSKELRDLLRERGFVRTQTTISTMLAEFKKQKKLYVYKVKGLPAFYALPEWINAQTNKLKFKFDPYTKTRINEPEDYAI